MIACKMAKLFVFFSLINSMWTYCSMYIFLLINYYSIYMCVAKKLERKSHIQVVTMCAQTSNYNALL